MFTPLDVLIWCGVAIVAILALFIIVALLKGIVDTLRGSGPVPKSRRSPAVDKDPNRRQRLM